MKNALAIVAAASVCACGGSGTDDAYPNEPNESRATATPLTLGEPVVGTIQGESDLDYYSFVVPQGGATVRIETFDGSGVHCGDRGVWVKMYDDDAAGTLLADFSGYRNVACMDVTGDLTSGKYFLLVDGFPYPAVYTLKVSLP